MQYFHVALAVKSIAESMAFYDRVFGYTLMKRGERPDISVQFVMLRNRDGNIIELFEHTAPQPLTEDLMDFSRVGVKHLAFTVDDIEATVDLAVKNGSKIIWPIQKGVTVSRIAFVSDPNGIPIELVEL